MTATFSVEAVLWIMRERVRKPRILPWSDDERAGKA